MFVEKVRGVRVVREVRVIDLAVNATLLAEFHLSDEKILKIIRSLNPNKAHGWDKISVRMIKMCDSALIVPLKIIFANCLSKGIFPDIWNCQFLKVVILKYDKVCRKLVIQKITHNSY